MINLRRRQVQIRERCPKVQIGCQRDPDVEVGKTQITPRPPRWMLVAGVSGVETVGLEASR